MSYLLKDSEKIFVGSFAETSENQFTILVTNCDEFLSENLSLEVLMQRVEIMNETIRYKQAKVLKILKENQPETCSITNVDDSLRFDLKVSYIH